MMELHHCWLSSTLLFIIQIRICNCKIDSSHDKWNLWDPVAKFDIDPANADRNILKCSLNRWLYIKNPESFVNYWNFGLNFTTFASHSSILYFVVVVPTWCRTSPRDWISNQLVALGGHLGSISGVFELDPSGGRWRAPKPDIDCFWAGQIWPSLTPPSNLVTF